MKSLIVITFLLIHCLISKAQIIHDTKTDRVSESLDTYQKWRNDMLTCDTLRKKQAQELAIKDSTANELKKQILALNKITAIKDSTNRALLQVAEKKDKTFNSPFTYIIAVGALFLGIAIGK